MNAIDMLGILKEASNQYTHHLPNLQVDDNYLITDYYNKDGLGTLLYNKKSKTVFSGSSFYNDIDHGLNRINPFFLHNNIIFSLLPPDPYINHYEKHIKEFKGINNNFTQLAKRLDFNSPLILTLYQLK
jgi:hypothetical protein